MFGCAASLITVSGFEIDAGSAGHVVENQRPLDRIGDGREVAPHPFLRGLVVVRRDDEERRDGQPVDGTRQLQRLRRRVRPGAGDDRNAPRRKLARLRDDVDVLVVIECRRFAGRARDDERLGSGVDMKIDDASQTAGSSPCRLRPSA